MEYPKQIHDFMLLHVTEPWTFKGKTMQSAQYIRLGTRLSLHIQVVSDKSGEQEYILRLRDSFVFGGIKTLTEAIKLASEIIEENHMFVGGKVV